MRERGLKYNGLEQGIIAGTVAPGEGAWIEIPSPAGSQTQSPVAPPEGAWIAIVLYNQTKCILKSLPVRERGLKLDIGLNIGLGLFRRSW